MIPRIRNKALELLSTGREIDQYALAAEAHCLVHSAWRVLHRLHEAHEIHVAKWKKSGTNPLPVYAFGPGTDMPKPRRKTVAEVSRAYRKRHPHRVIEQGKRRKITRVRRARRAVVTMPDALKALTFFGGNSNG